MRTRIMARIPPATWSAPLAICLALAMTIADPPDPPASAAGPWKVQNSGTTRALFGVACPGALRCYAVGAAGTVRATTNGGATWKAQPNPATGSSTALVSIACPTGTTCYAVGTPNVVLITHNGGNLWKIHSFTLAPNVTLSAVACLDAATCYVVGGPTGAWFTTRAVVYLTTNGGANWLKQSIPATVPCNGDCGQTTVGYPLDWVSCLPNNLCRAGGIGFIDSHSGFAQATILSLAPGASWPLLSNDVPPSVATCPSVSRCYGIQTVNPFSNPIKVWVSGDGGTSWTLRNNPTPRVLNAIACPGVTTCAIVGDTGAIVRTTNGNGFFAESSPTFRNLYGVACVTTSRCFAVGNKGAILART
jgi:photosystem II stability/assembly factor-like uncharacterized protein